MRCLSVSEAPKKKQTGFFVRSLYSNLFVFHRDDWVWLGFFKTVILCQFLPCGTRRFFPAFGRSAIDIFPQTRFLVLFFCPCWASHRLLSYIPGTCFSCHCCWCFRVYYFGVFRVFCELVPFPVRFWSRQPAAQRSAWLFREWNVPCPGRFRRTRTRTRPWFAGFRLWTPTNTWVRRSWWGTRSSWGSFKMGRTLRTFLHFLDLELSFFQICCMMIENSELLREGILIVGGVGDFLEGLGGSVPVLFVGGLADEEFEWSFGQFIFPVKLNLTRSSLRFWAVPRPASIQIK